MLLKMDTFAGYSIADRNTPYKKTKHFYMRKLHFTTGVRYALALLVVAAVHMTAHADVYLIGSFNDWQTGTKMSTTDDVTFTLKNFELTTDVEFRFNTDGENVEAGTQYCAAAEKYWFTPAMLTHAQTVTESASPGFTFVFKDATGKYDITLSTTDKTVTIVPSSTDVTALYLVGGVDGGAEWWHNGVVMRKTAASKFVLYNHELTAGTYFRFATGSDCDGNRNYCATAANTAVTANRAATTLQIAADDNFYYTGATGRYNLVVDLAAGTMTLSPVPCVYVYDTSRPHVQLTAKRNGKDYHLNGRSTNGNRITGETVHIGNLDWYCMPIVPGSDTDYPITVSVDHLGNEYDQNPSTTDYSNPRLSWYAGGDVKSLTDNMFASTPSFTATSDDKFFCMVPLAWDLGSYQWLIVDVDEILETDYVYYIYPEESYPEGSAYYHKAYVRRKIPVTAMQDLYYVSGRADAEQWRLMEINILQDNPAEARPTVDIGYEGAAAFATDVQMLRTDYKYGRTWWRGTYTDTDPLSLVVKQEGRTGTIDRLDDVAYYRWQDGALVRIDESELNGWRDADMASPVVVHLAVNEPLNAVADVLVCSARTGFDGATAQTIERGANITRNGRSWMTFEVPARVASVDFTAGSNTLSLSNVTGEQWMVWEPAASGNDEYVANETRFMRGYGEQLPDAALDLGLEAQYVQYVDYNGWDAVYASLDGAWPGLEMTPVGHTAGGNSVYLLRIDNAPSTVTFNNGLAIDDAAARYSGMCDYAQGGVYDAAGLINTMNSLSAITAQGATEQATIIADDLVAVFYDRWEDYGTTAKPVAGVLYVKDDNAYGDKSRNRREKGDYLAANYTRVDAAGNVLKLNDIKSHTDQSTWAALYDGTGGSLHLEEYNGKRIPGGKVHGMLLADENESRMGRNPRFWVTAIDVTPAECEAEEYTPNVYIPSNFYRDYVDPYANVDAPYYFVAPKAQEYAEIDWAVFDGEDFSIPQRVQRPDGSWHNYHDLNGNVQAGWELLQDPELRVDNKGFIVGEGDGLIDPPANLEVGAAYRFKAIVRLWVIENAVGHVWLPANVAGDDGDDEDGGNAAPRRAPLRADGVLEETDTTVPYKPVGAFDTIYMIYPIEIYPVEDQVTGVAQAMSNRHVIAVEYYNLAGVRFTQPQPGVNIVVKRLSDGSTQSTKHLYR